MPTLRFNGHTMVEDEEECFPIVEEVEDLEAERLAEVRRLEKERAYRKTKEGRAISNAMDVTDKVGTRTRVEYDEGEEKISEIQQRKVKAAREMIRNARDEGRGVDAPTPGVNNYPVTKPVKRSVKRILNDAKGFEKPQPKGDALVSFRLWPRGEENEGAPLPDSETLDAEAWKCDVAFAHRDRATVEVCVDPPRTPPGYPGGRAADDLDEWLQLPAPVILTKAAWACALDDCLRKMVNGEKCAYETLDHGGWRIECELHEILRETNAVGLGSELVWNPNRFKIPST